MRRGMRRFQDRVIGIMESLVCLLDHEDRDVPMIPVLREVQEFSGPLPEMTSSTLPFRRGRVLLMATLTNTQQTTVTLKVKNRRGGEARFDGEPSWSTDNSDVLRLEPAFGNKMCRVIAAGPLGEGNVTVEADADLGDGVQPIFGTINFQVTAGSATVIELEPGPIEEQPDTPPDTEVPGETEEPPVE